jgi:hypothetical protein
VLAHGYQTELETLFDFGCRNHAAPDGAEMNPTFPASPFSRATACVCQLAVDHHQRAV